MIKQEHCTILSHRILTTGFYHLVVSSEGISNLCKPGQFANIRVSDTLDPLLRRPISFFNYEKDHLEFIYKQVGYGTELLTRKIVGESIDIMGPLGSGFFIPKDIANKRILVVGGGMGIIPLYTLIKELKILKKDFLILYSSRTKKELLLKNMLITEHLPFEAITDDGSFSRKGLITDLLIEQLSKNPSAYIYCCGPHGMIQAVSKIASEYNTQCQVSLEERMACGVGACIGCVIEDIDGNYQKVCKDGPIFMADKIKWHRSPY